MARKKKLNSKEAVISFRTPIEVQERIDREAKRRKQTRTEFVEAIFLPALDAAAPVLSK